MRMLLRYYLQRCVSDFIKKYTRHACGRGTILNYQRHTKVKINSVYFNTTQIQHLFGDIYPYSLVELQ